jgi:K+-sensing histidine kinase KdpD
MGGRVRTDKRRGTVPSPEMNLELRAFTNLARAASAGSEDVAALLSRLTASIAETFSLGRIDAYRYLPDGDQVTPLPVPGHAVDRIDDLGGFREALAKGETVCVDHRLVVPLIAADGCIGFLEADCDAEPPHSQMELMSALGAFAAAVLQRALEREELERLSRLKSQFIALASHELRAPAAVIHGVAKTVVTLAQQIPPDQLAALHETLAEHTDRMTWLIEELLDLSRLEAKAIEIERAELPVRERAEQVLRAVAGDRGDEIVVDIDGELRPMVDPVAFDRILGNLATNALRYGRFPVTVKAVQNDRHFRLTVEDRGDGVAPGFVPHLFERFSREERADAKKGAGLGLAIAQAYAHAHGGQLFYEDATPHGARFQLVLPAQ